MNTGTIKFFNEEKWFGFITPDEGGKDIFIHKTNLQDDVTEGDRVQFTTWESEKWTHAENASIID